MHRAKRWLFLIHRWMGITACLFFAMWFVSGVVMMYVGYPKLTTAERLAHLPVLDAQVPLLGPDDALVAAGIQGPLRDLRLARARARLPVYLVEPQATPGGARGGHDASPGRGAIVVDAVTGKRLPATTREVALASAAAWAGADALGPVRMKAGAGGVGSDANANANPSPVHPSMTYLGEINEDAFSHSRGLDAHRPLHVVDVADTNRTRLYISGRTGEVVRDAPRTERFWNYAGAWIHWLYPFRGNVFDPYWSGIVNTLSVLGLAVALTGTVVGILRWRFGRVYRTGSRSPYTGPMMRWHHISGLLFAAITITWIFSGWMSMNPWKMFSASGPALQVEAMHGGRLQADAAGGPGASGAGAQQGPAHAFYGPGSSHASIRNLLMASGDGAVRELRWTYAMGRPIVLASAALGVPQVLDARTASAIHFDEGAITTAAARLMTAPVAGIDRLVAYDTYYYARDDHTMTGGTDKPLPILRVRFDDPSHTWVHIDPRTASVIGQTDDARRLSRWLFAMLHSWDWLPLLDRRPLWDTLLILLSLGGAALSVTGVVIGWRRLGRKLKTSPA
ncbi:PepSY domain-containing protein [Pigmentiphaga litoralis]|uniref:PepSY domain-containing protein n=1 Tax=Pigmentiphaga litoralis TaxID=516702 RepID=UPI003B433FFB